MPTKKGTSSLPERLFFNRSRMKDMQCSDLSSTILGILILQYVLEMRNTTFLGLGSGIASENPNNSLSLSDINKRGGCGVKPSI